MCEMPLYGSGYGHLFSYGVGLRPGYNGFNYGGYGHLQGYGVGLHPGYDPYGTGYGYVHLVPYPVYYPVRQYVQEPFRGGKG
ncbi:hypothetical protein [Desulfosporosinus sp. FKA]|uniref:hypothetical protein n=1 Tax=Desulfosporosinus sp. FKA TaxID=1969834 RepID=UPI000B4A2096|nr:hypothetical protein [Desulfosporosinus sp. FKA]